MTTSKGRVYRRCACRRHDGRQWGAACPDLSASPKHCGWYFEIPVRTLTGARRNHKKGGFATKRAALAGLDKVVQRRDHRVTEDAKVTVGEFLPAWLHEREHLLKASTLFNYRRYVELDIVPALGTIPLQQLHHDHIRLFVADLIEAGRGPTTIRRCIATLSSALADAVEQRRIMHNPATHVTLPKIDKAERVPWTATEAVTFLDHVTDDRLGPLFELLVGTGLRRGEALALTWDDIDIDARALYVRRTLSDVGGHLVFSEPKTRASAAGVGLPSRVVAALEVQAMRQQLERDEWGDAYDDGRLVFARESGAPIRPEHVLKRFGPLCSAAGVPKIRIHDLRHTAATLMIGSGVPLAIVSKVLRHTQVSITADLYGHLSREIATSAADTFGAALDAVAAERFVEQRARLQQGPGGRCAHSAPSRS